MIAADGTRIADYRPWMEAELAKDNGDIGASRPMKVGTTPSRFPYGAAAGDALQLASMRCFATQHYASPILRVGPFPLNSKYFATLHNCVPNNRIRNVKPIKRTTTRFTANKPQPAQSESRELVSSVVRRVGGGQKLFRKKAINSPQCIRSSGRFTKASIYEYDRAALLAEVLPKSIFR